MVIDQVWGQDGWILAKFFFVCLWTETKSVHKLAKKKQGQYPVILTKQTWSIKDLLYGFWGNFARGIQRVVPSGQDGSILPARGAGHIIILHYGPHTSSIKCTCIYLGEVWLLSFKLTRDKVMMGEHWRIKIMGLEEGSSLKLKLELNKYNYMHVDFLFLQLLE